MVDFENEAILTKPAQEIMRLVIMQRRHDLINAIETYNIEKGMRVSVTGNSPIRAKASSLAKELKGDIQRAIKLNNNKYTFDNLIKDILENNEERLFYAIDFLLDTLDPLTRITEKKRIL